MMNLQGEDVAVTAKKKIKNEVKFSLVLSLGTSGQLCDYWDYPIMFPHIPVDCSSAQFIGVHLFMIAVIAPMLCG